MGTKVQTSPKISRFLALFGSLSLFTAHAIIPPMIPKKSGTRYQAALTCCTGFHGVAVAAVVATPLAGAPQFGQNTALSAISLPHLWQNMAQTHGLLLIKCPKYLAIDDHPANSEVVYSRKSLADFLWISVMRTTRDRESLGFSRCQEFAF